MIELTENTQNIKSLKKKRYVELTYELLSVVSSKLHSSWRRQKGIRALLNKAQNNLCRCTFQILRRQTDDKHTSLSGQLAS